MRWGEDGWLRTIAGDAAPDLSPPRPDLPSAPWDEASWNGNFKDGPLPQELQWLRSPAPDHLFSLSARPGFLRLYGRETVGSLFSQALVARRQQHFRYTATTRLEFDPIDYQQAAGLICYYNSTKFHYLHISRDEGRRVLQLMSAWPDDRRFRMSIVATDLPDGPIELKAELIMAELRFHWRAASDDAWQDGSDLLDASILSDEASLPGLPNFTGAFVGVACQDVAGLGTPADFAFFRYEGLDPD
jgi:xylan 1,4-beta-xylosidase